MGKKIFILIVVLLVLGGGFFYWWKLQADVRAMNKGLPEGVRVTKNFGGQYKVNNKKDGYVVAVPEAWKGLAEVEYSINTQEARTDLVLVGTEEKGLVGVDYYNLQEANINLESWVQNWLQKFGFSGEIKKENVKNFEIIKVKEEKHLAGAILYFFKKDSQIYEVSGMSEEFIKEIILKSEW